MSQRRSRDRYSQKGNSYRYKSDEIMARSLDSLLETGSNVAVPEIDKTLEDETLEAEVKEILSLNVYQELMKGYIDKIIKEKTEEAEVSRMEAAKAMGMMEPGSALIQNLIKLLGDKSPEVVKYALESAGKLKRREFIPLIIQHLRQPAIGEEARRTLVGYGARIIGTLKDYLSDKEEDILLRKSIPDILAQIGTQRAADILSLELKKQDEEVEPEIIEGLFKLRSKNPDLRFQPETIFPEVIRMIKKSYLILFELQDLKDNKKGDLLLRDLENLLARSLRHIFELLSLIYPQEDIIRAYQNICLGTKKSLDYSIELLDNIVKKEISEVLLPLIEDLPLENKVQRCRRLLKNLEKLGSY